MGGGAKNLETSLSACTPVKKDQKSPRLVTFWQQPPVAHSCPGEGSPRLLEAAHQCNRSSEKIKQIKLFYAISHRRVDAFDAWTRRGVDAWTHRCAGSMRRCVDASTCRRIDASMRRRIEFPRYVRTPGMLLQMVMAHVCISRTPIRLMFWRPVFCKSFSRTFKKLESSRSSRKLSKVLESSRRRELSRIFEFLECSREAF